MTQQNDKSQAAFEAVIRSRGASVARDKNFPNYELKNVQFMWQGWQARGEYEQAACNLSADDGVLLHPSVISLVKNAEELIATAKNAGFLTNNSSEATAKTASAPVESVNQGLVDALRLFIKCAYPVAMEIDQRGYAWSTAYLDAALPIAEKALRAAESQAPAFSEAELVGMASKIIQDMPLDDYSSEEIATEIVEALQKAGALRVREG